MVMIGGVHSGGLGLHSEKGSVASIRHKMCLTGRIADTHVHVYGYDEEGEG